MEREGEEYLSLKVRGNLHPISIPDLGEIKNHWWNVSSLPTQTWRPSLLGIDQRRSCCYCWWPCGCLESWRHHMMSSVSVVGTASEQVRWSWDAGRRSSPNNCASWRRYLHHRLQPYSPTHAVAQYKLSARLTIVISSSK